MEDRLKDAILGTQEGKQTFKEALEMVSDGLILETLHSKSLGQRFEDVRTPHEGTFRWIFSNPGEVREKEPQLAITFPDWLKTGSGIFHIAGKPGSGKSTLMKYLCRHEDTENFLKEWAGERQLLFAKFFFWRMGTSQEQKSLKGLVRGLLYEVLCKVPTLTRILFPTGWERASQKVRGLQGIEISAEEIIEAFDRLVQVSASPDQTMLLKQIRICFFIDGLDEFDQSGLNETHGELANKLLLWAKNSGSNVKICVSSRIQEPFIDKFPVQQRITLDKLTTQDIELVVKSRLEKHEKFTQLRGKHEEECEKLLKGITTSAQGVFLWVALLLNSLCKGLDKGDTIKVLQNRVADTPPELDDYLAQILDGIDSTYRKGAYLLLATVLRTTGNLLSTEERAAEYALYDESPFPRDDGENRKEFCLSLLSCFSILWISDKEIPMTANFELSDLDFLKEDTGDYAGKENWATAITTRCNGLLQIFDDEYVKFMHRSIPEFLQKYLRSNFECHRLDDYQITMAMTWAYLVEVKHFGASAQPMRDRQSESAPMFPPTPVLHRDSGLGTEYELDEIISDGSGGDLTDSRVHGPSDDRVDDCVDDPVDELVNGLDKTSNVDAEDGSDDSIGYPTSQTPKLVKFANDRLYVFLCRIRQLKLEEHWVPLFRLLLSIENTMQSNPARWPRNPRLFETCDSVRDQPWSLLCLCTYIGLHEFINWAFRHTQSLIDSESLFNVTHSAVAALAFSDPEVFSHKIFETLFANGIQADIVFPAGCKPSLRGKPVWHAFLLYMPPFHRSPCWDSIEIWLRFGANAEVLFGLDHQHNRCTRVKCINDGSGIISCPDVTNWSSWEIFDDPAELYLFLQDKEYKEDIPLRDLVAWIHPHNEREILKLIDDKAAERDRRRERDTVRDAPEDESLTPPKFPRNELHSNAISDLGHDSLLVHITAAKHNAELPLAQSDIEEKPIIISQQTWARRLIWLCLRMYTYVLFMWLALRLA